MDDAAVLELFRRLPKDRMLISARYVASELAVDQRSAQGRLTSLAASGHVVEVWGGLENDEWTIVAYGLTANGREALTPSSRD